MKKIKLVLLSLFLASATMIAAQAAEDVLPNISGFVTLQTSPKGSLSSGLEAIYQGREGELPGKTGRKILVSGTNSGSGASVTVTETDPPAGQAAYSFVIPVKSIINFSATARSSMKNPSIGLNFNGNVSSGGSGSSVSSIASVAASETISVKKYVAVRKGSKATVRGLIFSKGTAAKGRFKLTFTD